MPKQKFFKLELSITIEVMEKLSQGLALKRICGNLYGIEDEILVWLIKAWKAKTKKLSIALKNAETKSIEKIKTDPETG